MRSISKTKKNKNIVLFWNINFVNKFVYRFFQFLKWKLFRKQSEKEKERKGKKMSSEWKTAERIIWMKILTKKPLDIIKMLGIIKQI